MVEQFCRKKFCTILSVNRAYSTRKRNSSPVRDKLHFVITQTFCVLATFVVGQLLYEVSVCYGGILSGQRRRHQKYRETMQCCLQIACVIRLLSFLSIPSHFPALQWNDIQSVKTSENNVLLFTRSDVSLQT